FGIGDADRFAVAVHDTAAQPRAVIGHCEKVRAVGLDVKAGDSTKGGIFRGQLESAPEFQRAEAYEGRVTVVEPRDWRRFDFDTRGGQRINGRFSVGRRAGGAGQCNEQSADNKRAAAKKIQATRLRARGLGHSAAACSSNSSASFSVIAPPSSSASTMV